MRKVLSFIVTENTGITQVVLPYSSNYPDQFINVAIFSLACPLVVSKFFGPVNEIDSYKKPRQSDLVL